MEKIELLLRHFPLYSEDLGIDLKVPSGRFKWFLASILFGARISEKIAANTYKQFEAHGLDSPEKILAAGWNELVSILDEGGYVRYDFSTATKLLGIMETLRTHYGSLETLYEGAVDTEEVKKRLLTFKGIGTVTAQIFLREIRCTWQVSPEVSTRAQIAAEKLGINLADYEGEMLARLETALIKLSKRYCAKSRCEDCPVKDSCQNAGKPH